MDLPPRPDTSHPSPPATSVDDESLTREQRVQRAVELWKGQLVDLGGRNTLLYFRDLRQGTLGLDPDAADQDIVAQLLASKTVRLTALFSDQEARAAAAKRARTIRAKSKEMFEERGLRTLHIAWGMATWTTQRSSATPSAPVLLRSASISPRGGAEEDFDVVLTDEFEVNRTLLHLLKTDYKVDVEPSELEVLLDDVDGDIDTTELFDRLETAAVTVPGFSITSRVVLANFSYAKLSMVEDLAGSIDALIASDLIAAIAGDAEARHALRERQLPDEQIDDPDHVPLTDEFLVLDADASQNYAINAVLGGADLVIEGPPGTGKSQTIANLVATLVARGKRVLFVAEKRAAIDAVLDRLHRCELGDLVLDLHDGVGSRKKLAQELARLLATNASIPSVRTPHLATLEKRRSQLRQHADAMNEERAPWGVSVFEVQSALLGIPQHLRSEVRWVAGQLEQLDAAAFESLKETADEFVSLGGAELLSGASHSAWSGALRAESVSTQVDSAEASDLATELAQRKLPVLLRALNAAAVETRIEPANSMPDWRLTMEYWRGVRMSQEAFDPGVFSLDLRSVSVALAPLRARLPGRVFARAFNSSYRAAWKAVRGFRRKGERSHALARALDGASAVQMFWNERGTPPGSPSAPASLDGLDGQLDQSLVELRRLSDLSGTSLEPLTTAELLDRCGDLAEDRRSVTILPELIRMKRLFEASDVLQVLEEAGHRNLTAAETRTLFEHAWLSSIFDALSRGDVDVGGFQGGTHSRIVEDFRIGDEQHLADTPQRIRRQLAERSVQTRDEHPEESSLIQAQAKLKQRHLPPRDLFQAAPHVLTALKPCWAMSPLVVSQVLPSSEPFFDVVIFDEASQITPSDAVSSLIRARQAVVAGDPKQLPPTAFFHTLSDEFDETSSLDDGGLAIGLESVLDVMSSLLPVPHGTRTLSWHYRSHDERLIAFSNAQQVLYDWSLTTFPGVVSGGCLEHVLVENGSPHAGQEESASAEVNRVVDLILDHAVERPEQSLGVIAMGIKHADRIAEALRRARSERADLAPYFDEVKDEPFFVKNLERVQGDERDAIILTIGYGKSADGRMVYRFGPLVMAGGERRLNVAITRAKRRMTLVSSFSSTDMDPERLRSEGAQMLQRYLAYVESGGDDLGRMGRRRPEINPFERDVLSALTSAGLPLIAQYGVSSYHLDFAAQHPTRRGEMVLAIEADGAMYHSAHTTRERDRLRQEHLERLGWRFHRIWSTDWFLHREDEVERTVDAYKQAVRIADGESPPPRPQIEPDRARLGPRGDRPGVPRGLGIADYSDRALEQIVCWIKSDTLPRTKEDLLTEVMSELGFQRRGPRIVDRISRVIDGVTC
ncbi:MAG: AAA domain-containing protein [Actinomycetota bacterium]